MGGLREADQRLKRFNRCCFGLNTYVAIYCIPVTPAARPARDPSQWPPPPSSCLQSGEVEEFLQLPVQRAVPWRRRLRAPGGAPEGVEHRAQGAVRLVQVL